MNRPLRQPVVKFSAMSIFVLFWFGTCSVVGQTATSHRLLPEGETIQDARTGAQRSLDSYFPFSPPDTAERWRRRAELVRQQIRVSLGLWPSPTKTPMNPVIHGKLDRGDYTIEKVYFESLPGFYVTGNLYRPANIVGKIPGVLCPHGHYQNGRFRDAPDAELDQHLASGAEKFRSNARSPLQARCAHLARMGCTVFHYDMLGYADSQQITHQVAHRFREQRPEMNGPAGWGLFSPRAESHLQSVMGLQTWNSIRALDFLESLPEVDPSRLAVTGSSGGGTQTFIVCAIDPRPAVAFPAVMVSTAMQGGCTCENACNLRVETGNVEFAALFAPKPLGLTAADDWTKEMKTKGFPELQQLYGLIGNSEDVHLTARTEFGHNYNQVSREAMYRWFNRHLALNGPTEEQPIEFLPREELTVWSDDHLPPSGGEDLEKQLLSYWAGNTQRQLGAQSVPFQMEREGLLHLLGLAADYDAGWATRAASLDSDVEAAVGGDDAFFKSRIVDGQLNHVFHSLCVNDADEPSSNCVLWLHRDGKRHLLDEQGNPVDYVRLLRAQGYAVLGIDMFMQGEFLQSIDEPVLNRQVPNGRDAAAYTYGYNRPIFASRVRDVVNLVVHLDNVKTIVALDDTAPVAIVAAAILGDRIERLAVNTGGFRFEELELFDPNFFPGGSRYGDIPRYLAMGAPRHTWICGETSTGEVLAAYRGVDAKAKLVIVDTTLDDAGMIQAVAQWLED